MKVQQVNSRFKNFAEWQIKNRFAILAITLVFIVIGLAGLPRATSVNDREQWFGDTEAIEIATQKFEEQFGNSDSIAVLIEAEDVFDPQVLRVIDKLGDELLAKVPYAKEVTSLTETEISVGTESGMQIINPFEQGIPTNSAQDRARIEEIRNLFFSRKAFADKIVTTDSKETWLILNLNEYPAHDVWTKETNLDPMFQVGEAAMKVITDPKLQSDAYTLKPVGMPYTETEERDFFEKEIMFRMLTIFITMVLLLGFFLRSFFGVLIPSLTAVIGIMLVFGYMGWFGIGINANMVMMPMLLGMALSIAYSVHLVNSFKRNYHHCKQRKEAAILSVEETGWPLFFTVITTMGSLVSFISAGIIAISWTGLTSATLVFVSWLLVMLLIPIFLSFGKQQPDSQINIKNSLHIFIENKMQSLADFTVRNKKPLLIGFTIVLLLLTPGIFKVTVNMDMFEMMGRKIPYMERVYQITQSKLGSYISYNVSIDYQETDAIKEPEVLKEFEGLIDLVNKFKLTKTNENNSAVLSILDILKEMNQTVHSDDSSYYRIPESRELVTQLLFLYEISGGEKLYNWIDEDYSMLRLDIPLEKYNANEIVSELDQIKKYAQEHMPNAEVNIIGSAAQFAEMNHKIVMGELKSIIMALFLISVLLIFVFGSFKTGLIGMIPNVVPMIFIGGYMGYTNASLDMMTMTIIPMLLGIAVDDTIHFINHIKYEYEISGDYQQAVTKSFQDIGSTLLMTTIILSVGFSMFMFSPINTMARIGMLSSLGLLVALVSDYIMTPILILYTKPFDKQ